MKPWVLLGQGYWLVRRCHVAVRRQSLRDSILVMPIVILRPFSVKHALSDVTILREKVAS
jgi:hypothetical protein